ncbi:hypothetical protein [Candidatus Rariloculus sp.]|uniref:hypothetical protein n=1 Tax=Candidatus Rariloculus sp. TaxID=3101265 RepID=UPI003D096A40
MALAAFTPTIWAARFLSFLDQANVYSIDTNRNYEGEIKAAGDTVKIPTFTKAITIGTYDEDAAIGNRIDAPEEVAGNSQEMAIDQFRYFNFAVDDVEETQTKPNLMDAAMSRAGVGVSTTVDGYLEGIYDKAFDNTYTEIPGANNNARGTNISARTVTIPVATTVDATGGAFGIKLLEALTVLKRKMSAADVPLSGRWLTVHPDTIEGLERWALTKGSTAVYTPSTTESVLTNGYAGNLLGFRLKVTSSVPSIEITAANDGWRLFAGQGNEAVTYGSQIAKVETYRPERSFSDAVKGLYVYGARNVLPTRLYAIEHKKA